MLHLLLHRFNLFRYRQSVSLSICFLTCLQSFQHDIARTTRFCLSLQNAQRANSDSRPAFIEAFDALSRSAPLSRSPAFAYSGYCLSHPTRRLRGGYRNSDILRQYILVSSKAGPSDGDGSALQRAALARPPNADAIHRYGVYLMDRKANTTGAETMFR